MNSCMGTHRIVKLGLCILLFGVACQTAHAQTAKVEIHPFESRTLTEEQFLTGSKYGTSVVIAGELLLPRSKEERLPAVVLMHGSGGPGVQTARWAKDLNEMGFAAFILDSFSGRGISDTISNQFQIGYMTVTYDAYRALDFLAKHPRIDPQRIAVMGFSRGARTGLYAALKRFRQMHGSKDLEFAAYLAFYAPCHIRYIDDENVSDRPIHLFHGAADDWVPLAPCRSYVERLRLTRRNIHLHEYLGAHHLFDEVSVKEPLHFPNARFPTFCPLEEDEQGHFINGLTRRSFSTSDKCMRQGATIAFNQAAHAEALKTVAEVLKKAFVTQAAR